MLIANRRREALSYMPRPGQKVVWDDAKCLPSGWLPANISAATIRWIRVDSQSPTDPFFEKWVAALRSRVPPAREHETELSSLAKSVGHLPEIEPAGIIFHVSRCGSTLLSNALSAGEDVFAIGEAPAVEKAMQMAASGAPRAARVGARALKDICRAFAHYRASAAPRLIVQTGMAAVTRLRAVRSMWPTVPCVMLIRDPLEVAVSNLQTPPKALLEWYDEPSKCFFPVPGEVPARGIEEFCAWLVGPICSEALEQLDDKCMLLDYRDLTPAAALRVAEYFSVRLSDDERDSLRRAFLSNAKHGGEFKPDADRKKRAATASLAESVARWALGPYHALLRSPLRLPAT